MSSRKYNDLPIKAIIQQMLDNAGMSKKYNELEIIKCYHEVMGSMISKRTREVKLRDRTLVLKMDSGVLKEELNHNKRQIIQMINDKMGAPIIEEVEVW
ncbi:MAG: DUF721 domain-containing protein [Flavobacteriales bacterium]|jgi:predicted nucleic acid-binding Zn ribbon protein